MAIGFKNIPANIRVPLFFAEVDNSQANNGVASQRALIIGQITAAGIATPNVAVLSQGVADAITVGGAGSMLARMTAAYRANDTFGELWYLPLADDPGAVAASGTITFTAAAAANGSLYLYVGGVRYAMPVLTTQTVITLASALAALINADLASPVNAVAAAGMVTLTAINKGPAGNDIDLRLNYQGTRGGEVSAAGLAVTLVQMTAGATAPSLTAALLNLGSQAFDFIVCPYTDTTSLDALKTLLNDTTGRWAWNLQLYGHYFAAYRGTFGAQVTLGTGRNDQHGSILGVNDSPTPTWLWAAALAGATAASIRIDPALPVQTLAIQGVLAPPLQSRFQLTDQNTLLYDGISTYSVADDGTVAIQNLITTYQKNVFGSADNSYLEVETMFTLAYVLRALKTMVTSKYARVKLAADGTRFATGSAIVTPNIIRADLIAKYRELETAGLVQNGEAFKQGLVVQQNAQNPNRVDVLFPSILINQLRVFALLSQFRLQ